MTTVGKKPIVCWLETDAEGGIESTLQVDARKRPAADGGR